MGGGRLCIGEVGAAERARGHCTLGDPQLEPQGARPRHGGWQSGWEDGRLEGQELAGIEDTADVKPEVQCERMGPGKTQNQRILLT